jgi:hypothetical protein
MKKQGGRHKQDDDEEQQVFQGADHWDPARAGGRVEDGGRVPSLVWIDRRCVLHIGVVMMATSGRVFARSGLSAVSLDIGGWGSCWPARAL